jgi:5'/3'-nucleotidase SurE
MRILLSNDDGISAPGIQTLASALREFAQVQIVAPDRNRSGSSNALTLDSALRITYYVLLHYPMAILRCNKAHRQIVSISVSIR